MIHAVHLICVSKVVQRKLVLEFWPIQYRSQVSISPSTPCKSCDGGSALKRTLPSTPCICLDSSTIRRKDWINVTLFSILQQRLPSANGIRRSRLSKLVLFSVRGITPSFKLKTEEGPKMGCAGRRRSRQRGACCIQQTVLSS